MRLRKEPLLLYRLFYYYYYRRHLDQAGAGRGRIVLGPAWCFSLIHSFQIAFEICAALWAMPTVRRCQYKEDIVFWLLLFRDIRWKSDNTFALIFYMWEINLNHHKFEYLHEKGCYVILDPKGAEKTALKPPVTEYRLIRSYIQKSWNEFRSNR